MTAVPETAADSDLPSTAGVCLQATDYGFRYDGSDRHQLQAVRFAVRPGERVAVMGATGAGKTTLAMSLNGLVPHHHDGEVTGDLVVLGSSVPDSTINELVRRVGLVMQDPESQITGRTVLEDAAVGPANLGLDREAVLARARDALGRVGLAELEERDTGHLSGGQQQRLAIAGILAMAPQLLVLDEPTSELDPAGAERVFEVIRSVSGDDGRTVVLVEHAPELVAEWADRLLVLVEGRLVYDGVPAGFFSAPELVDAAALRQPGAAAVVSALRDADLLPSEALAHPLLQDGLVPVSVAAAVDLLRRHVPVTARARAVDAEPPPADDRPVVLRAVDLEHRYPSGVLALDGVSVDVRHGDFVALLGSNGAGKTTFARHLNGLLRPTGGTVEVYGRPTAGRPLHELATEVGYVFQNPDHQIFATSVFDEVAFGLRNQGRAEDDVAERVRNVVAQVGMTEHLHTHPYRLGKGQRQRLAVASVLALQPDILVIDEPTTGQDWAGSLAMMELVRSLNGAGHTIVMITHDMALAARYARRALVFDGGRVAADRPVRDLFVDGDLLRRAQLRPPQVTELALALGMAPVTSVDEFVHAWGGRGEA